MRVGSSETLSRLLVVSSLAYFAFWACAPPSVVAPMVPMPHGSAWDVGGAVSVGVARTSDVIYESAPDDTGFPPEYVGEEHQIEPAGGAQVWSVADRGRVDLGLTIGGTGVRNEGGGLHGGAMFRPHFVENDQIVVGLEVQLGWFWGSVGLPVSVRASDRVWVYIDPSLGRRFTGLLNVPVGVSVELAERARLNAELNYLTGQYEEGVGFLESGLLMGSVGVSFRP